MHTIATIKAIRTPAISEYIAIFSPKVLGGVYFSSIIAARV